MPAIARPHSLVAINPVRDGRYDLGGRRRTHNMSSTRMILLDKKFRVITRMLLYGGRCAAGAPLDADASPFSPSLDGPSLTGLLQVTDLRLLGEEQPPSGAIIATYSSYMADAVQDKGACYNV